MISSTEIPRANKLCSSSLERMYTDTIIIDLRYVIRFEVHMLQKMSEPDIISCHIMYDYPSNPDGRIVYKKSKVV